MKKKLRMEIKSRYGSHSVILDPDPEGGYVVTAPQCPELVTWGKTITQAKAMAQEAMELCIEYAVEERLNETKKNKKTTDHNVRVGIRI